jgi:hypothetical protein
MLVYLARNSAAGIRRVKDVKKLGVIAANSHPARTA